MGWKRQSLLFPALIFAGFQLASAEPGGEPTVPVVGIASFDGNRVQVPGWSPAMGQALSGMLSEALRKADRRIQILEGGQAKSADSNVKPARNGAAASKNPAAGGAGDPANPAAGDTTGSDFILYGNVTEFAAQTNGGSIGDFVSTSPFAKLGANLVTARVRIDWRLVDAETAAIITRGTGAGFARGSGFDLAGSSATGQKTVPAGGINAAPVQKNAAAGIAKATVATNGNSEFAFANNILGGLGKSFGNSPAGAGSDAAGTASRPKTPAPAKAGADDATSEDEIIGYNNSGFMESALGRATAEAVSNVIEQLAAVSLPEPARRTKLAATAAALRHTPEKILAVAGKDAIIVSLGSNQGFKEGDQLELYQTVDIKDDKGNVVYTDEKLVGELTLESVQADRSRASGPGEVTVQQGWIVKAK